MNIEIKQKKDFIGLVIDQKVFRLLATTPPHPKGAPKELKRLIRIRANLFRELAAFNKELKRHNL